MTLRPHTVPFSRLADLAEGRLSAAERAETRAHVADCPRCAAQLARLESTLQLMRADTSEDAPRDVLARAVSMFRERATASASESGSLVRKVLAALSFDSAALRPAFGLRSAQAADAARQMLFTAGETEIDLRLARGGDGWVISGQVLGECASGGRVEVESLSGGAGARADLNDLCEFTLAPVADGSYRLRLLAGETEVEIPEIELTA